MNFSSNTFTSKLANASYTSNDSNEGSFSALSRNSSASFSNALYSSVSSTSSIFWNNSSRSSSVSTSANWFHVSHVHLKLYGVYDIKIAFRS